MRPQTPPQGRSLVVQVSGGALARTSSVAPSIKIKSKSFGENRVDTIFRAGLGALLFFCRFERTLTRLTRPAASIYDDGIVQISAPLDRAFFAANLQLERIRASEPRRGDVCEISTLPERDRAMLRRSDQIQSFEDRVATGTKIARAGRSCSGCD